MLLEQPDVNYENARRQHYEFYAPALVNAWWMRVFCAVLLVVVVLQGAAGLRTAKQIAKQKIVVLSGAKDGSFDRVEYVNMADYQPDDRMRQHFAYVWAVKYYSRVRATIATDYTESLAFFAPDVVRQLKMQVDQTHWIQEFQDRTVTPEIRIEIQKIRLENGSMTIDMLKHFYLNGRELPARVENWTTQVAYTLTPISQVSNGMIPVNPIGLRISTLPVETKEGFAQ
jgi:hypothetical protein